MEIQTWLVLLLLCVQTSVATRPLQSDCMRRALHCRQKFGLARTRRATPPATDGSTTHVVMGCGIWSSRRRELRHGKKQTHLHACIAKHVSMRAACARSPHSEVHNPQWKVPKGYIHRAVNKFGTPNCQGARSWPISNGSLGQYSGSPNMRPRCHLGDIWGDLCQHRSQGEGY